MTSACNPKRKTPIDAKVSRRRFAAAAGAGLVWPRVMAQAPGKALRVVGPYPAGGGTDAIARLLADRIGLLERRTVIVDNRGGAGGRLGVQSVKHADSDGSVLLFSPDFPLTIYPHIYKRLPYELDDFSAVAACATSSYAICVGPALMDSIRTVPDLIAWCRTHRQEALYGSPSAGSAAHFAGFLLARSAGLELTHVPYKGGASALQDLISGQVPFSINPIGEILQYAQAGRLRLLATTGAGRSQLLPDVPTLLESGIKESIVTSWAGFFVPARTPAATIQRLNAMLSAAIAEPGVTALLQRLGMELSAPSSSATFSAAVHADSARWKDVVRLAGFSAGD